MCGETILACLSSRHVERRAHRVTSPTGMTLVLTQVTGPIDTNEGRRLKAWDYCKSGRVVHSLASMQGGGMRPDLLLVVMHIAMSYCRLDSFTLTTQGYIKRRSLCRNENFKLYPSIYLDPG